MIEFLSLKIVPKIHNLTDFNYEIMLKNTFNTLIYIKGKREKKSNKQISMILEDILQDKTFEITWGALLDPINSQNDLESTKSLSIENTYKYLSIN